MRYRFIAGDADFAGRGCPGGSWRVIWADDVIMALCRVFQTYRQEGARIKISATLPLTEATLHGEHFFVSFHRRIGWLIRNWAPNAFVRPGAKFYDLSKSPATCPKCGHVFDPLAAVTAEQTVRHRPDLRKQRQR